ALEEHDAQLGVGVAVPAHRLVKAPRTREIGDAERDQAEALLHRPLLLYSVAVQRPCGGAAPPCARILAAWMAALRAPLMAMQATGTPSGICTTDISASMPPRLPRSIGTPITGSSV